VKPVNLLPEGERSRRTAQAAPGNASYIVLGVLGALLLAMVGYVMTQNQISSRTSEIARAEQEKAVAEQRASRLAAFGDFAEIKETRVRSVTELAESRFDWERLMRELSLVLPEDTWLTDLTASASPEAAAAGTGGATTPSATTGATTPGATTPGAAAASGPTVTIGGCSKSQEKVAVTLVRLRKLYRASDVQLNESAESETAETPGTAGAQPTSDPATAGTSGECAFFAFEAIVSFDPSATAVPGTEKPGVPAELGGGS